MRNERINLTHSKKRESFSFYSFHLNERNSFLVFSISLFRFKNITLKQCQPLPLLLLLPQVSFLLLFKSWFDQDLGWWRRAPGFEARTSPAVCGVGWRVRCCAFPASRPAGAAAGWPGERAAGRLGRGRAPPRRRRPW